jgi:hypothetical protein
MIVSEGIPGSTWYPLFFKKHHSGVKLPGHRPGLPGNVISLYIVPLDPAHGAGLAGHVPATQDLLM